MKKTIITGLLLLAGVLMGAPSAKAEIVTSSTTLASLPLHAAVTSGIVVKSLVFNAGAAQNTVYVYDGTTIKFQFTVPVGTSITVNFKQLLGEDFVLAGALNVKCSAEDALGRVTITMDHKRTN